MTGSVLRNALIFGASSATVVLVGAKLFLRRPLSTHWLSRLQVFAAGALFAILAIELMPDLIIAHHFAALMAFLFGVALLLALKWFTVKMNQASQGYTKTVRIIVSEAFFYMFMVGLLIGSGFAVGVREGLLLALALTAAALAICLGSLDHLQRVVATPPRVTFFVLGLGLFLLSGVVSSIVLLTTQSLIDLDLLYAFSLAVFLLWVLETFIETREDESPIHTLFFFFIGAILFLFLAGWFGRSHSDHPGRPATITNSRYNRISGKVYRAFLFTRVGK